MFGESNAPAEAGRRGPSLDLGDGSMNCRDTIHLICWYLEGKLSPTVEQEIERHLEHCSDCRLVLDAATTTLDQYFATGKAEQLETGIKAAYSWAA